MVDAYKIVKKPVITKKIWDYVELQNKIVFEVTKEANKSKIKLAIEELYNVRVDKVNTYITPFGIKRAICTLSAEYSASDLANELNLFG